MYRIPKEISSELKFTTFFSATDIPFLAGVIVLLFITGQFVHSSFRFAYIVVGVLISCPFMLRIKESGNKKAYFSYYYYLIKKLNGYSAHTKGDKEVIERNVKKVKDIKRMRRK